MKNCGSIRDRFSEYLDGALTGVAMQQVAAHLETCRACSQEFEDWRQMQQTLSDIGPAKAPADLALRLRVALSQEHARTPRHSLEMWQVRWSNTLAPFLLRASAGFASAVLLIGSTAVLIGAFAPPVEARDEPSAASSSPRFLYSMIESNSQTWSGLNKTQEGPKKTDTEKTAGTEKNADAPQGKAEVHTYDGTENSVVVEAYVNSGGRVYDYKIISGPDTAESRAQIETMLLFSVFEPARVFGEPVQGVAVLSLSGIAVQG
jgi:hypothetical protein